MNNLFESVSMIVLKNISMNQEYANLVILPVLTVPIQQNMIA